MGFDPSTGFELYRTDALGSAPQLVADLNPGPDDSQVSDLIDAGGNLFFDTPIANSNAVTLYRSGGTPGTTSALGQVMLDGGPGPVFTAVGAGFSFEPGTPQMGWNSGPAMACSPVPRSWPT